MFVSCLLLNNRYHRVQTSKDKFTNHR